MKKFFLTIAITLVSVFAANAMSYEQARDQALFLTDKMAYELNLTQDQYEAAYEINLDYLMGVNTYDDLYASVWTRRNMDLSYILLDWQYRLFCDAAYFYRPLYWDAGCWHFSIYSRYPNRTYFYFSRPVCYVSYRGGHAWHMNGGHSWYHNNFHHSVHHSGTHVGMRDNWNHGGRGLGTHNHNPSRNGSTYNRGGNSGSYNRGNAGSNYNRGGNAGSYNRGNTGSYNRGGNSGSTTNRGTYGGSRESSTRTTVTRVPQQNGQVGTTYNRGAQSGSRTGSVSSGTHSFNGGARGGSSFSGGSHGGSHGGGSSQGGGASHGGGFGGRR